MAKVSKSSTGGAFVGRTSEGGLVPHAGKNGLPGADRTVREVRAKNAGKAQQARERLAGSR
jgi:hypothetical protein